MTPPKPDLDQFARLAQEGCSLIPLNGKQPFEQGWQQWCKKNRPFDLKAFNGHNAGICCGPASNRLVLDVDDPEAFEAARRKHGWELPDTLTVKTGKGKHYHFQYPNSGETYGNRSCKDQGFDVRGLGGVVVAPGSIHPETGAPYAITTDIPLAPAPVWLAEFSRETPASQVERLPLDQLQDIDNLDLSPAIRDLIVQGSPQGSRSENMMKVLNALTQAGAGDEQIFDLFANQPIGEKYREKGSTKDAWLRKQIIKARKHRQAKESPVSTPPTTYTATELLNTDIQPPEWIIPNLLMPGVTILAAPPKTGKTRLMTEIAFGLATGTQVLASIPVKQTGVLFLCLEDSPWRIKERLLPLTRGDVFPDALHLADSWPPAKDGGVDQLDNWLKEHPDIRVVIIDVLTRIRRPDTGRNVYQEDYEVITELKILATNYNIALVLIHHTNKNRDSPDPFDRVSGSTGLTGAVDTVAILERPNRGEAKATLTLAGRDVEHQDLALEFDRQTGAFRLLGDAHQENASDERKEIVRLLEDSTAPMRSNEIAKALDKNHNTTRGLLTKMLKAGQLSQPQRGLYAPPTS